MLSLKEYLTDGKGNISAMNLFVKDGLTPDDYTTYTITDTTNYRLDLIAERNGLRGYEFFIMMMNEIRTMEDLGVGIVLNIPNISYIQRLENQLKKEVLQ